MSAQRKLFLYFVAIGAISTFVYLIKPTSEELDQTQKISTGQIVNNETTTELNPQNTNIQADAQVQEPLFQKTAAPQLSADVNDNLEELAPQNHQTTNAAMNADLSQISPPNSEDLKNELSKESHSTPPSLMGFARDMVPHVQRALTVESYSESVFSYLVDCALDNAGESLSESARASCYMNAFKIAQQYPDKYKTKFETLKSNLPERIKELVSDFVSDS